MKDNVLAARIMSAAGWFFEPGAYVLVDGQFGSTGKGAFAAFIGTHFAKRITVFTTNAGPNSGHTGYYGDRKVVTRQLPVAALGPDKGYIYLNAGAVIDYDVYLSECNEYDADAIVHPCAAMINDRHKDDVSSLRKIASTGKGVGQALAAKVLREGNVARVQMAPEYVGTHKWNWARDVVFVETAQGFSLGINTPEFYPYTTSRETTVGQALADARIPAQLLRKVVMTLRTFPIRVGNTQEGYSGDWYPDQKEMTWEEVGVEPELTTVTKRVRRVASWSRIQFRDAVAVNRPNVLFLNFLNYLPQDQWRAFTSTLTQDYLAVIGKLPPLILGGVGPKVEDIGPLYAGGIWYV